jgi:hypothetical protein
MASNKGHFITPLISPGSLADNKPSATLSLIPWMFSKVQDSPGACPGADQSLGDSMHHVHQQVAISSLTRIF